MSNKDLKIVQHSAEELRSLYTWKHRAFELANIVLFWVFVLATAWKVVPYAAASPWLTLAAFLTGGVLSLGSIVGFITVLGVAARNSIMLVSHYRHLEIDEGVPFSKELVIRGSLERISPIIMTALTSVLALLPIILAGNEPGSEIEHPMSVVILGGVVTSTVLNLLGMPALYWAFGRKKGAEPIESQPAVS